MRAFEFSLSKMYRYKDQILNKEKQLLGELQQQKATLEQKQQDLECYRLLKSRELQAEQKIGMNSRELSSFRYMLETTKYQIDDVVKQCIKLDEAIARQLKIVIAASQEVSALEKLEEKQRCEYQKEQVRAESLLMLEHITTAMTRKSEKPTLL